MEISAHGTCKRRRLTLFYGPLYYAATGGCYKRWKVARFREKVQGRMDGVKMHNIAPRTDLEKRAIFFRLLIPLLATEWLGEGEIDLSGVQLTHYRLKDQGTRRLNLKDGNGEVGLLPPGEVGSAEGRDLLRAMLSAIIQRMNDCASHASQPGVLSATYSPAGSRRTPAVTVRIGALPAA